MSALSNDPSEQLPEPPPGYHFEDDQRVHWGDTFAALNAEQDRTVLGWVRIQRRVSDAKRLRRWEIAQRLDVSTDLLDVRYEPSLKGSESWNEHRVNEISADRTRRKIRSRKKQLAEKWGWDTWIRWARPETLKREQVLKVEAVQIQRDKNAAYAAEGYDEHVRPREERAAKVAGMTAYEREVFYLEEDIAELPVQMRAPMEEELRVMIAEREIAYRKNQRMGLKGLRAWQLSVAREVAERGQEQYRKAKETRLKNRFAGMSARDIRATLESERGVRA